MLFIGNEQANLQKIKRKMIQNVLKEQENGNKQIGHRFAQFHLQKIEKSKKREEKDHKKDQRKKEVKKRKFEKEEE